MADLDIIQTRVLQAISNCTVFGYKEVESVYLMTRSFDGTIDFLNKLMKLKQSPQQKSLEAFLEKQKGYGVKTPEGKQ